MKAKTPHNQNVSEKFPDASPLTIVWLASKRKKEHVDISDILSEMCAIFDKNIRDIKGKSQLHEFVIIRYMYMYVACKITKQPKRVIAKLVNRERSVAHHGYECIENYLSVGDYGFKPIWNKYIDNTKIYKN